MNLFNTISYYVDMFFIVGIVTLVFSAALLYYLIYIKKITASEEKVDYSTFNRLDAMEYVKFDDIVSETDDLYEGAGMICLGNNTFVGGISVQGYNYWSASEEEQVRTMLGAMSFANVIEDSMTIRQSVVAEDLTENVEEYKQIEKDITIQLMDLDKEYQDLLSYLDDNDDDMDIILQCEKQLKQLHKKILTRRHVLDETRTVIEYLQKLVSDSNNKKKKDTQASSQIIYSYTFDASSVTEALSKEEIYLKAFGELNVKSQAYRNALSGCGCSTRALSASDLIMLMRKQCAPLTCDEIKLEDLLTSSYNTLFITCDSLLEAVKQKISNEKFENALRAYEEQLERTAKEQASESARYMRVVEDAVTAKALEQMEEAEFSW